MLGTGKIEWGVGVGWGHREGGGGRLVAGFTLLLLCF